MSKYATITVQQVDVKFFSEKESDYFSLTDIAKQSSDEPRFVIQNWMKNTNTVRYLYEWENLHNAKDDRIKLADILENTTSNRFTMSPSKWIDMIGAVGMYSKSGRNGGTYAHRDIALNFCYWLSPIFQIYLIKEFQRLKEQEAQEHQEKLGWNLKRVLSKINYSIQTDAIKETLIPQRVIKKSGIIYANEADILNVALFGMTAKEWRMTNQKSKGNIREFATTEQLLVLANLEAINAELIRAGISQDERVSRLNEAAISQMQSLINSRSFNQLPDGEKGL